MRKSYVKETKEKTKVRGVRFPIRLLKEATKKRLNVNQICNDALIKAVKDEESRAK
jgi:hypothetical protein